MAIENKNDGSFVNEIANLVHPTSTVQQLYKQKALVVGSEVRVFDDPMLTAPTPLRVSTLGAVVEFIRRQVADCPVVVNVVSPTEVQVVAPLVGEHRQQFTYLIAAPELPDIVLGKYMAVEEFLIQLGSCFVQTPEREEMRAFCSGNLKTGKLLAIEDDGVCQKITTLQGVQRSDAKPVRNPWILSPFRTFPEVPQPDSDFLLRFREAKQGQGDQQVIIASAALFEADGGAWRQTAISSIGAWLCEQLDDDVTILA